MHIIVDWLIILYMFILGMLAQKTRFNGRICGGSRQFASLGPIKLPSGN